jgi:hypothetical protein
MKKPKELTTVNVNDMQGLLWWSCHLGVSPEKLLEAVRYTGQSAVKVQEYIRNENHKFFIADKQDV